MKETSLGKGMIIVMFVAIIVAVPSAVTEGDGADANYDFTDGILGYTVTEGGCSVTYYDGVTKDVRIPAQVSDSGNTFDVISIGDSVFKKSGVASVTVEGGNLSAIGFAAFAECEKLISFSCAGCSNLYVKDYAFSQSFLKSADFIERATYIGSNAFSKCPVLTIDGLNLSGAQYIGDYAFANSRFIEGPVTYPALKTVSKFVFSNTSITSLKLSGSTETIGEYAFAYCTDLKNLDMGNGVKEILEGAFAKDKSLGTLKLSESLTYIGTSAFDQCKGLRGNLVLPTGVTYVGDFAFDNCGYDGRMDLGRSLVYIGAYAFAETKVNSEFVIPDTVETIGQGAFFRSIGMGNLVIGESVLSIGINAFTGCKSVTGVTFNNSVPFDIRAFDGWTFYDKGKACVYEDSYALIGNVFGGSIGEMIRVSSDPMITYDSNQGSGSIGKQAAAPGSSVVLSDGSGLSREGMFLCGWALTPTGSPVYALGQTIHKYSSGSITLYAAWSSSQLFTVSYDTNGGTLMPDTVTASWGEKVTVPEYSGKKAGCDFIGWEYKGQMFVSGDTVTVSEDVRLKAVWSTRMLVVFFDTDGGSKVDSALVEYGKKVAEPENPTKWMAEFSGWYTDEDFKEKYDFDSPVKTDITLYAKWKATEDMTMFWVIGAIIVLILLLVVVITYRRGGKKE